MKIVSPSFEMLPAHGISEKEILQRIERCGRICYKSEDRITTDSCIKFVQGIITRGHEAVLEHASLIFLLDFHTWTVLQDQLVEMGHRKGFRHYLRFTFDYGRPIVSGNIRAWRDYLKACCRVYGHIPRFIEDTLKDYSVLFPEFQTTAACHVSLSKHIEVLRPDQLITAKERLTHYDRTVIFTCDLGISHEIVRHRPASYCQESTRYCNYSKEGFGSEITVIRPCYLEPGSRAYDYWRDACEGVEIRYFDLLNFGLDHQEARAVLPTSLKTEVCMTTHLDEWRHFLRLRGSKAAHPQIRELALPLCSVFTTAHGSEFGGVAAELGV